MSPLSTGVLGAATVVSAPALWLSLVDRTLPLDVALTRYLVAVALCWALLSLVTTWAFPAPGSIKARPAEPDERTAERTDRVPDGGQPGGHDATDASTGLGAA